jgi:hypothetical protein
MPPHAMPSSCSWAGQAARHCIGLRSTFAQWCAIASATSRRHGYLALHARIGKGAHGLSARFQATFNLSNELINHGQHQEAINVLSQGILLAKQTTRDLVAYIFCASHLVRARVCRARQLLNAGSVVDAPEQLHEAANVLPPARPVGLAIVAVPGVRQPAGPVEVLSALGHFPIAHTARPRQQFCLRASSLIHVFRGCALITLACLYERYGRTHRAIGYE